MCPTLTDAGWLPNNNVCRYISSLTHLSFSWSGFKFTLPVKMYYWGIGTSEATLTSLSCDLVVCLFYIRCFSILKMGVSLYSKLIKHSLKHVLQLSHQDVFAVLVLAVLVYVLPPLL